MVQRTVMLSCPQAVLMTVLGSEANIQRLCSITPNALVQLHTVMCSTTLLIRTFNPPEPDTGASRSHIYEHQSIGSKLNSAPVIFQRVHVVLLVTSAEDVFQCLIVNASHRLVHKLARP
jgi:hypothetical protein